MTKDTEGALRKALEELAHAVLDLNHGWNAKEPEHLIAERIDLARRLASRARAALARHPKDA